MLLRRTEFTHWVMGHLSNASVGYAYDPFDCPLARYLTEKTGVTWCVTPEVLRQMPGFVLAAETPRWAAEFLRRIDQNAGEITAQEALRVLDSL